MRVKTANQANFAKSVGVNVPRSSFRRNSSLKTTFNCGDLVPIYCDEVLPGDTFIMDASFVSRLSTPIFPTMDDLKLELYAVWIPNRLVCDQWEEIMGENKTSSWAPSQPLPTVPSFNLKGMTIPSKSIADYYGLPPITYNSNFDNYVSWLPLRGYALAWNELFRDENLQAPIVINKGAASSVDANSNYAPTASLLKVNKPHDMFTSALPAPVKGDSPLIPIDLNQLIPVITGSTAHSSGSSSNPLNGLQMGAITGSPINLGGSHAPLSMSTRGGTSQKIVDIGFSGNDQVGSGGVTAMAPVNLYADARGMRINGTTLTELRDEFQILRLLERDARGGSRYIEQLKAHFGVDAGDYRLQRPEFLGRYTTYVGMQSVPQTSSTDATSPQGNLAAYSVTGGKGVLFKKSFVEHGYIHIFAVARQVKTYQQGIERFWFRRDRFDFYWPELSHISEQPIYEKELFNSTAMTDANNNVISPDAVFGYQEAWCQYRYKNNRLSGQMRSGVTNSLDVWHYADWYTSAPLLSDGWIQDNSATNVNRTLAVSMSTADQIRMDICFGCISIRPMPVYSVPGLLDHF